MPINIRYINIQRSLGSSLDALHDVEDSLQKVYDSLVISREKGGLEERLLHSDTSILNDIVRTGENIKQIAAEIHAVYRR